MIVQHDAEATSESSYYNDTDFESGDDESVADMSSEYYDNLLESIETVNHD